MPYEKICVLDKLYLFMRDSVVVHEFDVNGSTIDFKLDVLKHEHT